MELTDYQHTALRGLKDEGYVRKEDCSTMPTVERNRTRFAISPIKPPKGKEFLRCVPSAEVDRTSMKTK